jgi:Erv1 / Alr family
MLYNILPLYSFEIKEEIKSMNLDARVWGPHFWYFLHTASLCYPHHPSPSDKRQYYNLIQNLPLFMPSSDIGKSFGRLLDLYPVTPFLDTRESFVRWVHFIHNKVNQELDKPIISIEEFYKSYYDAYKPLRLISKEQKRINTILKHLLLCACLVVVIFYLNNKGCCF